MVWEEAKCRPFGDYWKEAHIPQQKKQKLSKNAYKERLVGYDNNDYRIWVIEKNKYRLIRSRSVIFDEKLLMSFCVA